MASKEQRMPCGEFFLMQDPETLPDPTFLQFSIMYGIKNILSFS